MLMALCLMEWNGNKCQTFNMFKFLKGQKCKVIHNLLAPHCVGQTVTILGVVAEKDGRVMYRIDEEGRQGYAAESCLEAE